jgi:aminoglycoside phosphotransferase (APT) family kinase protein
LTGGVSVKWIPNQASHGFWALAEDLPGRQGLRSWNEYEEDGAPNTRGYILWWPGRQNENSGYERKRLPVPWLMSETANFLELLYRKGHLLDPQARLTPLSGGVSSEIYLVQNGARQFVVKRALPKLKVKDTWYADVSRNKTERDYFECVSRIIPGVVPQLYFSCPDEDYFGMEYLGHGFSTWKNLLLAGGLHTRHADLAGSILCEIHQRTAGADELRKKFDTTANFHQLRVETYLLITGARHPTFGAIFYAEARRIEGTPEALVYGDFSPKNILIQSERMVLLDCEVAWYGDAAFDFAFLLNHLFLKSPYRAPGGSELQIMVDAFWRAYMRQLSPGDATQLDRRLVPLLLMLLLARVDGKSSVKYLTPTKQNFIRAFVYKHLPSLPDRIAGLCSIWVSEVSTIKSLEVHA